MRLGCCEATITLWSPSQPLGPSGLGPLMGKSTENPAGFGHFSGMFWIANAESFDLEGGITGKTDKNFMALPDSSSDPEIEAQNEMVKMGLSHFPKPSEAQVAQVGQGNGPARGSVNPGYLYLLVPCRGLGETHDQWEFQNPKSEKN